MDSSVIDTAKTTAVTVISMKCNYTELCFALHSLMHSNSPFVSLPGMGPSERSKFSTISCLLASNQLCDSMGMQESERNVTHAQLLSVLLISQGQNNHQLWAMNDEDVTQIMKRTESDQKAVLL